MSLTQGLELGRLFFLREASGNMRADRLTESNVRALRPYIKCRGAREITSLCILLFALNFLPLNWYD
jgi:hypothetical protein